MNRFYFDMKNTHDEAKHGTAILSENNLKVHIDYASNIGTNLPVDKDKTYWEYKVFSYDALGQGWMGVVSGNRQDKVARIVFRFYVIGDYTLDFYNRLKLPNASVSPGSIVGMTLDKTNKVVGVYVNGVFKGNIQFKTNELELYPVIGNSNSGDSMGITAIANFGATPFVYPVPEGYRAIETLPQKRLYLQDNVVYGMQ